MTTATAEPELLQHYRWTVSDFHKMAEAGILSEDARVELIDGEIIEMSPIGSQHSGKVNRLGNLLTVLLRGKAIIAIQNPVTLNERDQLQPDIALLRWRDDYYEQSHPHPEDVLLLIEIAESSTRYDRHIKIPLYARNNIPEVWLLDLPQRRLEIYHSPEQGNYTHISHHLNGRIAPILLPEAIINMDDLFPAQDTLGIPAGERL